MLPSVRVQDKLVETKSMLGDEHADTFKSWHHAMHLDYQTQIFDVLLRDVGAKATAKHVFSQWKQVVNLMMEEDCLYVGISVSDQIDCDIKCNLLLLTLCVNQMQCSS